MNKSVTRIVLSVVILAIAVAIAIALNRTATASVVPPAAPAAQIAAAEATATPIPAPAAMAPAASSKAKVIGNFVSANQVNLAFAIGGRVGKISVKEGDRVKQGDLLASLDTSVLELQVAQAQAGLAIAQARLAQTKSGGTEADLAAAQTAVAAARANYNRVAAGPSADDLASAKANLDRAQAALDQAQAVYDRAGGASNPFAGMLPSTLALQQATSGYQAALAAYNLAKNHPTLPELAGAAVQVAQAESALARLVPTAENLTIAQAGVEQAQAALELAKQNLANAKIVAPFDGTVIWLGPKASEAVGANATALTLADLSKMQVTVTVDEITLTGIKSGQSVTLSVDALDGKTLTGKVKKIGLLATSAGGIVSVPVTIDVDPTDAPIYPGLSATVEF